MTLHLAIIRAIGVGAALSALSTPAGAATNLTVRLSDMAGSITIFDNVSGLPGVTNDTNGEVGLIDFDTTNGSALASWSHASGQVSACSGICPSLSASIEGDNVGGVADTLTLEISAINFTLLSAQWLGTNAIGGTTPATITAESFWSDTNTLFERTFSIGGPFTYTNLDVPVSGFSTTLFDSGYTAGPFSITTIITITHGADQPFASQINSDTAVSSVPVPAAAPLLAAAFGALGLMRLRRSARS